MAATPHIEAPQGVALVATRMTTSDLRLPQAVSLVPYNVPTKHMQSTYAGAIVAMRQNSHIEATSAPVLVVCEGRTANPAIRAFTFTLDGHDFYALRLGDSTTLLYDFSAQQWTEWTSPDLPFWRVNCAMNWVGGQAVGYPFGSDIVAGDDTYGLLYFLNPTQPYDDHPDYTNPEQQLPFERIVMSQTTVQGRENVPCYAIFLDTDNYGVSVTDFVPTVMLSTSDDQGQTFIDHDTIQASPTPATQDFRWYSLGQMQSPGRLFRVTDNGLITRIDAMQMNDG